MAIFWLCLLIWATAAQVVHQWTRQRRGEGTHEAYSLQVDDVGNAWVAGYTESSLDGNPNASSYDIFLMKFDAQGVHLWTRQRGGEDWDYAYALQVDDVGNAWVAGATWSSLDGHANAGSYDIFLMKFDAQGVHLWTRQRGGRGLDDARALKVHVCPVCAKLPPEMPTLGLAATYLVDIFPPLARRVTRAENPNFYDICPNLAHGSAGMGYNRTCPRDGRPHCSIVDALEDAYSGKVTHFVSWCWAYSLNDVVSAIERWVQKSNEDARNVFLWMCFFCNNQYRIKEEATQTGSDDLKEIFESHLVEAGHMLVLLDTIVQPTYVKRAWCIFESYVCITQEIPMNIILPCAAETFFKETMSAGRISVLTDAMDTLNVRHARAGSEKDEDLIKRIILTTTGFDAVNYAVKSRLLDQLTVLFRELFRLQPS